MLLLMMNFKKIYRTIKIHIFTVLCIWFLWSSMVFAESYIDKLDGLIGTINSITKQEWTDKELFTKLVSDFCDKMTSGNPMIYGKIWYELRYNAKNSLFMYRLCMDTNDQTNIARWSGLSDQEDKSYVKFIKTDKASINVLKNQLPSSFTKTSNYIETLFDTIAASYTSVYQASVYWKKWDEKITKETLIDEFSKQYLSGQNYISICAKDKKYQYPQTCKKMTSYLQDASNSLKSSDNILNVSLLYQDRKKLEKKGCDINKDDYSTITCGLYGNDITKFVNLMYNELFFYTSFTQYYTYILETQPQFKTSAGQNQLDKTKARESEIWLIRQNVSDSRKAVKTSIRLIKELQMTFPMHIWLLMYTEAINTFVQKFNETLIPIYTLWDIFRNVQDTK